MRYIRVDLHQSNPLRGHLPRTHYNYRTAPYFLPPLFPTARQAHQDQDTLNASAAFTVPWRLPNLLIVVVVVDLEGAIEE
jgi:hypothetical protein